MSQWLLTHRPFRFLITFNTLITNETTCQYLTVSEEPSTDYVRKRWLLLRRTEQFVIGSCVLFCLIAMAAWFIQQRGLQGRIIEIDRADPMTVQFKVDINTAAWSE